MTISELRVLLLSYPQDAIVTCVTRLGSKYDCMTLQEWDITTTSMKTFDAQQQIFVDIGEL